MNSNVALAAGTLAAILTVLGAGELFASPAPPPKPSAFPDLSPISLLSFARSFPLVYRFFFRAVIAYQNLLRFEKHPGGLMDVMANDLSLDYLKRPTWTFTSPVGAPPTNSTN